jgi:hypothetical protein
MNGLWRFGLWRRVVLYLIMEVPKEHIYLIFEARQHKYPETADDAFLWNADNGSTRQLES